MKNFSVWLLFLLLLACQSKKGSGDNAGAAAADSVHANEYKPDQEITSQNVTGNYIYVGKSNIGYTYCEFNIDQLDSLTGEFSVTLYGDKNETEYTDLKASTSYPLEIVKNDDGQFQIRPQIADIEDWEETLKKFPGLDNVFFADGSGWPMQNLTRSGNDFKLAPVNESADSILLKRSKTL